jgi:hypothetical protein
MSTDSKVHFSSIRLNHFLDAACGMHLPPEITSLYNVADWQVSAYRVVYFASLFADFLVAPLGGHPGS